ncbi:MAG TPA: DedA family protein [Actinomycetota bacterium]|nr:DedA family protein [Actinomycetota bacterium]
MLSGTMPFALITELVEWVRPFFGTFGYAIVSVAMFFESAALTGIFVPGDVILAIGGVYAAEGELGLGAVVAFGAFFGLLGETTGYLVGRRYGDSLLRRLPILRRFEARLDQVEDSIESNAGKTIVVGRFVTGAAGLIPFIAGASGVPARKFFAFTIPTMLLWSTAVALLGFLVGNHVETIDRILRRVGWVGLGLVALTVGIWIWRHRQAPESDPS